MTEKVDKIYAIAKEIYNELYTIVDATPNKFIDMQNLDKKKDTCYAPMDSNINIIGLAIFDKILCAYSEPQNPYLKVVYTEEEMLNADYWVTIDEMNDDFLTYMVNIAEVIGQYKK